MPQDYPSREFSSIDELCSLIRSSTKDWATRWFRGAKSPSYKLLPKVFREKRFEGDEVYNCVQFRRRAHSHLPQIKSPFDWLCAMQHYGFPTRLLDWSESLSVALYFTARPISVPLVAQTVWVMNPYELFELSEPGGNIIPIPENPSVISNANLAFRDQDPENLKATPFPLPVAPNFIFTRLSIQNGAFTIQGEKAGPLEDLIPIDKQSLLLKFVARKDFVTRLSECIDLIRPTSDAVFPDIEGLKDLLM